MLWEYDVEFMATRMCGSQHTFLLYSFLYLPFDIAIYLSTAAFIISTTSSGLWSLLSRFCIFSIFKAVSNQGSNVTLDGGSLGKIILNGEVSVLRCAS